MSRSLSSTTRPFRRTWGTGPHPDIQVTEGDGTRPGSGGALTVTGPVAMAGLPGGQPFLGMDPSNPATWVRPYRPQPGMIGYLNFDGAAQQGNTPMGGVWGNPAATRRQAGARPRKRPR